MAIYGRYVLMKRYLLAAVVAISPGAVYAADFVDTARVISSTPIMERVSDPKQECWIETVTPTGAVTKSAPVEDHSIGGAVLGGVLGGVVGNQVGRGSGKTVATTAGAIAGAIIGNRVASQKDAEAQQAAAVPQSREERHCRQIENYRDVIRGYTVTYRYSGKDITAKLPYDPGSTVKVGVSALADPGAGGGQ
jgi:uncharacterized protein YcfJ